MNCQIDYTFLGLIFSFLGSFFIALVLAKVFKIRKPTKAEIDEMENRGQLKDLSDEQKKDYLSIGLNVTSRVARYTTHFTVIGIILLFLGLIFQSLVLIADSCLGLLIILICGIVALAFFILDDL